MGAPHIDITYWAIHTIIQYMTDEFGSIDIPVHGRPTTVDEAIHLAKMDTAKFEQWAVLLVNATPTGGKPVDGEIAFVDDDSLHRKRAIVEVTSGKSNKKHFDAFMNHAKNADIGLYIVLHKPTKGMIADAKMVGTYHSLGWQQEYPRVQILEIDDLLHGKKPLLPPPYKKHGKSVMLGS